jgi:heme-degrading monooxygenase HmoA
VITAIVKYRPARKFSAEEASQMMRSGAENAFRGVPALYSKQFCYDAESGEGLSVYLWESKAAARNFFNEAFIEAFRTNMGCVPEIEYWPTMVVVDNRSDEVFAS